MDELQVAVSALQVAITNLGPRLLLYPEGTYDNQMEDIAIQIYEITTAVSLMAPTPEADALTLKAVE